MASGKDAKQRRQAQNRAQRERLAARRDAAKSKSSSSAASAASSPPKSRWQKLLAPPPAKAAKASAGAGGGNGSTAPKSSRPVRPGPAFLRRFGYEEPGGRAVHFALVLTVAASLMALFYPIIGVNVHDKVPPSKPPKGTPPDVTHITHHVTILQYQGSKAILLIAAPVVVALVTVLLSRPGTRKRTWGFGALALFVWVILGGIGIFYFVPAAAMGFGWWQAGKEEREARMAQAQKAREARQRGAARGTAAKPASPFGGLFKRRDVVDTTATETDTGDTGGDDEVTDAYDDDAAELADDAAAAEEPPAGGAPRARRAKPTKADVAAAIEAGRRGQRRGSKDVRR
jgi:hypothetical protein